MDGVSSPAVASHPVEAGILGGWPCDHGGIIDLTPLPDGGCEVWALVDHEWRRIAGLSPEDRAVVGDALTRPWGARDRTAT